MKRIISLDFMRGLAIMGMLASHVLLHISHFAQVSNFGEIMDLEPVLIVVFIIVFILSNFRAAFLMISMMAHVYSMALAIKKGRSPEAVLKKQLLMGAMLYLVGLFCEGIAANWGVIGRSLESYAWSWDQINHVLHFETLNSIAISIIVVSIIYYFLARNGGGTNTRRNTIVFTIIGVAFVALAPLIQSAVNAAYGGFYYNGNPGPWDAQYTFSSAGEFFLKLFLAMVAGKEQPIFPFMGAACLGAIVGMYLSQEKVAPDLPKKSMLTGLIIIVAGVVVTALTIVLGGDFDPTFTPHQTWFFLILVGLELVLIMAFMKSIEFNPKVKLAKVLSRTRWLRRWGIIALSVFVWQIVIELPIRDLGTLITGINFHNRGKVYDAVPTILMIAAVVIVWDIAIRLWEKARFVGSFEWIMATLSQGMLVGFKRAKTEKSERLNTKAVLYEPEPVMFVPLAQ